MSKEITKYPGKKINVEWDARLCIHIGECGYSSGDLFVGGRDPWCQPDLATVDDVVDAVKRCPTGAITVVDVTIPLGDKLVWRRISTQTVSDHTSPEESTVRINETVEKILAQFPPR